MAVNPGNYNPDNWSSGYRIRTVDSVDKRAELFNDFSYWMVRKFEIEVDTRHSNDMNIINLVNAATNNINAHAGYISNLDKTTQGINSTLNLHGGYINNIDKATQGLKSSLDLHAGYINTIDKLTQKHATELVGQSNRILANQVRLNSVDAAMKLYDGYFKNLTNKDLAIDLVLKEYDGYFKNLETKTKATDLKVAENSGYIKTLDNITTKHTADLTGQSNRILANQVRLNGVDAALLLNNGYVKNLETRADTVDLRFTLFDGYIKNLTARDDGFDKKFLDFDGYVKNLTTRADSTDSKLIEYDGYINALDSLAKTNQSNISALSLSTGDADRNLQDQITTMSLADAASDLLIYNKLSDFSTKNAENLTLINASIKSLKNYDDTSLRTMLLSQFSVFSAITDSHSNEYVASDSLFVKLLKGLNRITQKSISEVAKGVGIEIQSVGNKIKDYTALLTTLNLSTVANKTAIDSSSTKNAENLTLINATLKGLKNYDDASFKKSIDSYFKSDSRNSSNGFEGGILLEDGIVIKLIKGQFARLIAELNRHLTLSFTTTTNNIKSFKEYLREEFALLNDWASLQVDWSKMINDNILVAIAALDKIVLKPNGDVNVNVPVFDFDRLQKILEALSFGNVVNEAGTNLWDVLKELIETLGGVVEAVVGIVPDLIDKLIGLVIPENPNFFSEDVEALTSAFDMKFEWAFNLNSSFKSVFSQPKSLKSLSVPINGKNYKVVPDVVDLNMIKTIFTGYFCFLTLFTSYKRIVGGGDVIQ